MTKTKEKERREIDYTMNKEHLFLNLSGHLMNLEVPKVMGILNTTPDSFYAGSRFSEKEEIKKRVVEMINDGVDIIDVGGCSTRPGARIIAPDEEYDRIAPALDIIRTVAPEIPVSVDTVYSSVARKSVEIWGVKIINDISGGSLDNEMWETVADLKVPYVLTHMRGTPETMNLETSYADVTADVITDLSKKVASLHLMGVNDVIIDPGFGFSKTVAQNFAILDELSEFCKMDLPVLVGLSRKSMIWKTLEINPEDCLDGTIALEAIALEKGADILRVHDVKEARRIVKLWSALKGKTLTDISN